MKAVLAALVVAGAAEVAIYRSALNEYSDALCWAMMIGSMLGAIALGRVCATPFPRIL